MSAGTLQEWEEKRFNPPVPEIRRVEQGRGGPLREYKSQTVQRKSL